MLFVENVPDGSARVPAPLRGRALARAWFWTVTAAEFIGFAVPAFAGALTADAHPAVMLPSVVAAGAVEGTMLGWGQATVLRRALPGLRRRRWVAATACAAVIAYLIGLSPSTFAAAWSGWPPALLAVVGLVLGTALLASIGTAQWLILRHFVDRAARWIAATAVAWTAGLAAFLGFVMPLWKPGQAMVLVVAIGVTGGLLMAGVTSAITGHALRRMIA
jgi:hypothetical protein